MNIYQQFNSIVNKYSYRDEVIKKILNIFDGTGENQIISNELIPKPLRIKEFVIFSNEIERALNIIHSKLREIQQKGLTNSGSLFYFSQYGGSKTQFLNLVENEISFEIPNCITILFEDLYHINPIILFEQIFSQIFQIIGRVPKISEDQVKYRRFSNELRRYIGEIQVAIQQSSNLKQAEMLLSNLRKIKNPEMRNIINELDALLHSTILVDSIDILNKIIQLMQFCSQNEILFLFLFDEVDLWLDEGGEELKFSKDFNKISKIMKLILEIPDNKIKIFMVYTCTDRVNRLFQTMQHKFETISPVASRLNRIYNSSEKILEPGNYGSKIDIAMVTLAAYYHLANNRVKINTEIIEKAIPILDKKYKSFSRRMANSKIIQLLKNYQILSEPLKSGLKNWKNNTQHYGILLQNNLPSILNRLTIKFVQKDILVDPSRILSRDKIDGYFVNYSLEDEEIKTHVEIKLTKEFKGEKAYQALQYLQLHPEESLVMIIFTPTPSNIINKEIINYAENNGYDKSVYKRIKFILIDKPIAFSAINGISRASIDSESILEFLDAFANWFEFFSDFSNQYQEIKRKLGIDFIPPKTIKPPASEKPEQLEAKKLIASKLTPGQQTCLNLLSAMFHRRKFSTTGRMNKNTIQNFIADHSLGIADLEKYFELMDRSNIIEKITKSQVIFSSKIINAQSLEDLSQKVCTFFQINSEKLGTMRVFL